MADIKIKEKNVSTIKKLDKAKIYTQRIKDNIVSVKDKANLSNDEEMSETEYGSNKILESTSTILHNGAKKFNKYGKQSVEDTSKNIRIAKIKIKKKIEKSKTKAEVIQNTLAKENTPPIIKQAEKKKKRTLKNATKTLEKQLKKSNKAINKSIQGAKKAYQITKIVTQVTTRKIKQAVKQTVKTIKTMMKGTRAIIALFMAGGFMLSLLIIIICAMGMIFNISNNGESSSSDIVVVAYSQIGNTGEKYWNWFGFNDRVEWCACFVSWCANECRLY